MIWHQAPGHEDLLLSVMRFADAQPFAALIITGMVICFIFRGVRLIG